MADGRRYFDDEAAAIFETAWTRHESTGGCVDPARNVERRRGGCQRRADCGSADWRS